ncbi:hypothetical protein SAMN05444166_4037 [Singulisphaera sp. GP187]|uniref:hypothetical protein n=1 Tax=Singulisphaera sp. GP187 TaxID=1882752 RepID=UPI00092995F7|nr:hypothetical protein [Singulisphaera sp. GP187]SIO35460.1 hypothetical protein SAMN05444166_4037 [Singulisphaera sp. GP187]
MTAAQFNIVCNAIQAIGTAATPLVVVYLGARFLRHQTIQEAALSEKAKHYSTISPLINRIFSYRLMVGDFLERKPEEILKAKRDADHEFWSYYYVWSDNFIQLYNKFMHDSFTIYGGHGAKALINVDPQYYPFKPDPRTTNADGQQWQGFADKPVNTQHLVSLYRQIGDAISKDMGMGRKRGT